MEKNSIRYCTNCGELIPPNTRFCGNCGAVVYRSSDNSREESSNPHYVEMPTLSFQNGEEFKLNEDNIKKAYNVFSVVLLFLAIASVIAFFVPYYRTNNLGWGTSVSASAFQIMIGDAGFLKGPVAAMALLLVLPVVALFCNFIRKKQYTCWITFVIGMFEIICVIVLLKNAVYEEIMNDYSGLSTATGYTIYLIIGCIMIALGILGAIIYVVGAEDSTAALKKEVAGFGIVVGVSFLTYSLLAFLLFLGYMFLGC